MHLVMVLVLCVAVCAFLSETFMITFVFSFTIEQRSAKKRFSVFGGVVDVASLSSWQSFRPGAMLNLRQLRCHFPECSLAASLADSTPDTALFCQCHHAIFVVVVVAVVVFLLYIRLHSRFLSACCLVSFSNRILLFDLHQGARSLAQLPHRPAPPPKPRRSKKGVSLRLFTVLLSIFFQPSHLIFFNFALKS